MRRSRLALAAVVLSGGGGLAAMALPLGPAAASARVATAKLQLADGTEVGSVRFLTVGDRTTVKVTLDPSDCCPGALAGGLVADGIAREAFHGLHVHANDDASNGEGCIASPSQPSKTWFTAVDGHLTHGIQSHGDHAGDLPPLLVDGNGRAQATFTTDRLVADELVGKAVILHAGADNLGNVPVGLAPDQYTPNSPAAADKTHATGNAGDRIACGIIQRAN